MLRKGDGRLPSAGLHYLLQEEGTVYWDEQQLYLGPPFFFRSGDVYLSLSASSCACVGVPAVMFAPALLLLPLLPALTGLRSPGQPPTKLCDRTRLLHSTTPAALTPHLKALHPLTQHSKRSFQPLRHNAGNYVTHRKQLLGQRKCADFLQFCHLNHMVTSNWLKDGGSG